MIANVIGRGVVDVGCEIGQVLGERSHRRGALGFAQPVEQGTHGGPVANRAGARDPERHARAA